MTKDSKNLEHSIQMLGRSLDRWIETFDNLTKRLVKINEKVKKHERNS